MQFRPFGFYVPHAGTSHPEGTGNINIASFSFQFNDTNVVKMDLLNKAFYYAVGVQEYYDSTGPIQKQYQAGSYRNLPYITTTGKLQIDQEVAVADTKPIFFTMTEAAPTVGNQLGAKNAVGEIIFSIGSIKNNTSWQGEGWIGVATKQPNGSGLQLLSGTTLANNFSVQLAQNGDVVKRQTASSGSFYMDTRTFNLRDSSGVSLLQADAVSLRFKKPVQLPSYTNVAALPSAATIGAGSMVHCAATTTPGGACVLMSDGLVWKVVVALSSATTAA